MNNENSDLQQLKALALAATPGPWVHRFDPGNPAGVQHGVKLEGEHGCWVADFLDNADRSTEGGGAGERNAAFVAAANPAVVLGLIARIESLTTVPEQAPSTEQEWAKVDPAVAFHLIERHAEDWADAGRMMEAWRAAVSAATKPTACALPPTGWTCTRAPGHEGPCAAVPTEVCADDYTPEQMVVYQHGVEDGKLVARGMERYKAGIAAREAATKPAAAPQKDTPESMANSNARFAIDGAIQYGRENRNQPPSTDHWLYEYWNIGRQLNEAGRTGWDNVTPMAAAPASSTTGAAQTTEEVRDQALEDAALAAEKVQDDYSERQGGKWPELRDDAATGAGDCATAIRALKRPTPTHSSEAGDA